MKNLYVEVWDKFKMSRADAYPGPTVGPFKNETDARRFSKGLEATIQDINRTARTTSSPDDPSRLTPAPDSQDYYLVGVKFGETLVREHNEFWKNHGESEFLYWQRFRDEFGPKY